MKIAIGFYGFIRDPGLVRGCAHHLKNLIEDACASNIEAYYYYSCPDKVDEFSNEIIDKEEFTIKLKEEFGDNFYINFRKYDVKKYLVQTANLNYPIITSRNLYPYRVFSMMDAIQSTSLLIDDDKFDLIIMTRLDYLKKIKKISRVSNLTDDPSIYLLRNSPYQASDEAEDRVFWGSAGVMANLKDYYNTNSMIKFSDDNFIPEKILLNFFKICRKLKNYIIYPQLGTDIETNIFFYKYSKDIHKKVKFLCKSLGIKYNKSLNIKFKYLIYLGCKKIWNYFLLAYLKL